MLSILTAFVLFATTTVLFWSACGNGFVEWDDQGYVFEQPQVLRGIKFGGLLWAMTANVCSNWHPLTLISLQLDAQLFGPEPFGFHRTAVLIHAINAALAFYAILTLTGCRRKSAVVAALFAIHPLRVESVAWISERKDVLSGFFFFLTLIAYVRYVRAPSISRYVLVAICLALGLCAKSMLVTTPFVLLLLDYWPLGYRQNLSPSEHKRFLRLFLEKVPLLGLSAITSVLTVYYQKADMIRLEKLPFGARLENFARSCAAYLEQTCWPSGLSNLYPIPETSVPKFSAALLLLLILTGVALWQRNRRPYLLVGWLWFLGMLVPVGGLIQVGIQQRADRYTYLSQIGLFLAAVWGVADIVQKSLRAKVVTICLISALLIGYGFVTVPQIRIWRDTKSLWKNAYAVDPQNRVAATNLVSYAFEEGDRAEAMRLARDVLAVEDKFNRERLNNLAKILSDNGEGEMSIRVLDKVLEYPSEAGAVEDADLFLRRGEVFAALGRWEEAVNDYRQVVQLSPDVVPLRFCLAHALSKTGRQEEADQICAVALRQMPRWPESARNSAWTTSTSAKSHRNDRFRAMCLAEEANAITGGKNASFLDVLAAAYAVNGQFEKAVDTAKRAVQQAASERKMALAERIRSRLELYKKRQPYLEKG